MRGLAGVVALLVALALAPDAFAHASLVKAEPADGAMVAEPPAVLTLTFNEPVSPLVMRLIGPGGEVIAPTVEAENTAITVTPPRLRQGTHVLSWRVVSADGHPIGGAVVFSVGAPSAPPPAGAQSAGDPLVRAAIWTAKLVIYVGLFIGIGGAFFAAWLAEPPARPAAPLLVALIAAALVATPVSVGLQGLDALDMSLAALSQRIAWETGLETSYGLTAIGAALALFAGLLTFAARSTGLARGLSLAGLLGIGLALSLSGHASNAAPQLLTRPSVFLHGACVAFWVGAFVPLLAGARSKDRGVHALARFTRLIPYPLAILVVTGTALAVVQIERPAALWTTSYGLVLSAKLAAIVALLGVAAANRFALVPRLATAATSARPLVASIAFELAIALAILALVAAWRFTPPPRSLAAADAPISIHVHGERAMAQIEVEPRRPRGARFDLLVLDGELRPLTVKDVTLVLSNAAAGIEPVRRAAARESETTWRIDDLPLPIAGRWKLRVEILISDFEKVILEDDVTLPRSP